MEKGQRNRDENELNDKGNVLLLNRIISNPFIHELNAIKTYVFSWFQAYSPGHSQNEVFV